MQTTSALYRRALTKGHHRYVRAELWRAGVRIDPKTNQPADPAGGFVLPYDENKSGLVAYTSGSVRASLASRVTRTLSLTMHERWYPWFDGDPFNPWGDEMRVFAGVRFADRYVEAWPIFVGRISKNSRPDNGSFTLEASDLAAEVAGAGFPRPMASNTGASIISEFQSLVRGGLPGAVFGTSDAFSETVPTLIYDTDRGKSLDDLAGSVGAFWFTLGDGSFVMRRIPWLQHATPLLTLSDGPDGVLTKTAPTRDRSGVYNSWTLVSERTDGGTPIYVTEEDTDPASPIYVLGPYGRKAKTVQVQGASDEGQLRGLARQYVARGRALAQAWAAEGMTDPSLELGDTITVQTVRGPAGPISTVQVINGFTIPLTTTGTMPLDLRAQQPTGVPSLTGPRTVASYRNAALTVNAAASAASYAVAAPSDLQVGDDMYLIVGVAGTTAVTKPAGWDLVAGPTSKGTVLTVSIFRKTTRAATVDLGKTTTVALAAADQCSAVIVAVGAPRPINLISATLTAEAAAVATHAAPAISGAGDGLFALTVWAQGTITGGWAGPPAGDQQLVSGLGADAASNNVALMVAGTPMLPGGAATRTARTAVSSSNCVMGTILMQVSGS